MLSIKDLEAAITYLDEQKEKEAQELADKKFGTKTSYVKSLYKLLQYKKNGGRVKYTGQKPQAQIVRKQIKGCTIIEIDARCSLRGSDEEEIESGLDLLQDLEECGENYSDEDFKIEAVNNKEKINEVYRKYHSVVNMSYNELKKWSENPCSRVASLSRGPINRNLNLLSKTRGQWTMADVRSANRTISFISRMRGAEQGKKTSGPNGEACPSKRDISLKNWAYNP